MPRTPSRGLSVEKLRELARAGAAEALTRLPAEIGAIERAFPELASAKGREAVRGSSKKARTRTQRMSTAARKAVSQRMKKYWEERRKARAK